MGEGGWSYRRYDGWTQRFAPTWTALSSTLSFRAKRWISFPLPRGIPHCARNDRGTCCRDTNHCVSTVRTAFICVHLWNLCSDTVYLVHNHYPIGLKARFISALSRKGGVSMPIPWLEGCKPDIIVSGQYSAISQQINMSTIMQWRRLIGKFV